MGQGKCLKCGVTDLNWLTHKFVDDKIGYKFMCNGCGFRGIEWNTVTFLEIAADPDHQEPENISGKEQE